jgi:beta-N-acetylhexosaminidase
MMTRALKVLLALAVGALLMGRAAAENRQTNNTSVTLEEMIGQMLIVGFDGTRPQQKWPRKLGALLAKGHIGGVIFLKRNLSNARNARDLTRFFAQSATRHPAFIAVDQEGGSVQRLAGNVGLKRISSAQRVATKMDAEQAYDYYRNVARQLSEFGFNVNFGPVLDLNTNPQNPIIGRIGRSYSPDPDIVARYGAAFVRAHQAEGVITALKHFPGHGSSRTDSHLGFVDISETWREQELVPFARLISEGLADMVMIGHLHLGRYQSREDAQLPATFSRVLLGDVLRNQLKFDGVVISDDMEMGAIRKRYAPGDALIRAIRAGNDLLILSGTTGGQTALPERYIAAIKQAALEDPALKTQITQSYLRIVALKLRYLVPD